MDINEIDDTKLDTVSTKDRKFTLNKYYLIVKMTEEKLVNVALRGVWGYTIRPASAI